jgi:type 1 glutamine amidotransferase
MKKALIVWGGWDGHEPDKVAQVCKNSLEKDGYSAEVSDTLDAFAGTNLMDLHLIVPIWTMGKITKEQRDPVINAVANGVGIAGCHGGMCDAFREDVQWQFMTGGNWVSHPGGDGVEYRVNIKNATSPITDGLADFDVKSEQYYLHVDPAVEVLATTRFPTLTWFHSPNREVDMPVVWTKRWGAGRVFYTSLGHHADIFDIPQAHEIMRRGMVWAGEGKDYAQEHGLSADTYKSDKQMF